MQCFGMKVGGFLSTTSLWGVSCGDHFYNSTLLQVELQLILGVEV